MYRMLISTAALPVAAITEWRYRQRSERWRADLLKQLQRFTRYTYDHSRFYRQQWDQAGIHPSQIANFEDFARLPVIDPKVWRDLPESELRSEKTGRTIFTRQTGGTSSNAPLIIPFTLHDEWIIRSLLFQNLLHQRIGLLERKLSMAPRDPRYFRKHHRFSRLDPVLADADSSDHLNALIEGKQDVIIGNPIVIWRAVVAALRAGITLPPRRVVQVAGEVLTRPMRRTIEQALQTQVVQLYGATDYGKVAMECPHQRMHIMPHATYAEILRDGQPVKAGEAGEVVVTNFITHGRPLVRVRTRDLAMWSDEPCPCGRPLPVFQAVLGRIGDQVTTASGRTLYWLDVDEALSPFSDQVLGYQIQQRDPADVLVRLSLRDPNAATAPYHEALTALFDGLQITIERTDTFPPERSGKTRIIMGN